MDLKDTLYKHMRDYIFKQLPVRIITKKEKNTSPIPTEDDSSWVFDFDIDE
jgi:hypothetical protein